MTHLFPTNLRHRRDYLRHFPFDRHQRHSAATLGSVSTTRHRLAVIVVFLYFAALAAIAFWPTPVDRPFDGDLLNFLRWLRSLSIPQFIASFTSVEFMANIVLFMPFGIILAVRLPRMFWWVALPAGAVLSSLIELVQGTFLPERVFDVRDIVANSCGALIGALAVILWRVTRPKQPLVQPPVKLE